MYVPRNMVIKLDLVDDEFSRDFALSSLEDFPLTDIFTDTKSKFIFGHQTSFCCQK